MKDFLLNEQGDILIENSDIAFIEGNKELCQKIQQMIGTNLGEWFLDESEGIDFRSILTKNPNMDLVRDNIQNALLQIEDGLEIETFDYEIRERTMNITFTIKRENGEQVTITQKW